MLCLFLAYTPTSSLSKQCDRVRVAFGEYTWLLTSIELYSPHLCPNTSKSKKKMAVYTTSDGEARKCDFYQECV